MGLDLGGGVHREKPISGPARTPGPAAGRQDGLVAQPVWMQVVDDKPMAVPDRIFAEMRVFDLS